MIVGPKPPTVNSKDTNLEKIEPTKTTGPEPTVDNETNQSETSTAKKLYAPNQGRTRLC